MPFGATRDGGSDAYFAYRPNGGVWGANVRVNDLPGTVSGAPMIAVNASGNAYVVWQDSRNGHPDIYSAYRPANGSWGASRRINTDTGTAVQRDPAIGIDDVGIASIAWTDDRNGHDDIYFTSGTATGGWSPELRLNDDTSTAEQITPDLAVDGAGNVDVVWADGRNGEYDDIYTVRRLTTGVWSANELLAAHDLNYPTDLNNPTIGTNPAGFAYAGWSADYPWSGGVTYVGGLLPARRRVECTVGCRCWAASAVGHHSGLGQTWTRPRLVLPHHLFRPVLTLLSIAAFLP